MSQADQAAPQPGRSDATTRGSDALTQTAPAATQPAPPVPAQSSQTAAVWLRRNAIMVAGVVLIAAQLWWKAGLIAHSFFRLDDYFFLERAATNGLTWKYLMWIDAGHLTPVGFAIAWVLVRLSPDDWALASAATLVLLACTCLALLRMLRALFGDHPGTLILLLIYLISPLSFSGLSWWTVTLELLPLQLAIFCAVTSHLHYLRTGQFRHAGAAAGWLVVGMASSLRGAAVPLLLLALTSAYFTAGPWSRAVWATLRDRWRAWLLYAVITVVYMIVYVVQLATSTVAPGRPGAFNSVFSFASTLLRDTFIPSMLGGPWRWLGTGVSAGAFPPVAVARISWLLAAAVVVVSVWFSPRAWRAWTILAGWLVVVDILPVLLGRSSFLPGSLLGLVTRYVWDASGILVLCLGLAFLPLVGATYDHGAWRRLSRPLRTATASLLTATVIGSVWSFYSYPIDPGAAAGRSYVATARIALADAPKGTVIVDDPVPQDVVGGLFIGPMADASGLLSPLIIGQPGSRPRFVSQPDGTFDHLLEFDGWGRLEPSVISGAASRPLPAGRSCWSARNGFVTIRLSALATNPTTVRLGYLAGAPSQVLVEFGGSAVVYNVQLGLNSAFLPVQGSGRTILITALSGNLPCVGDAEAGVLLPSGAGPAIPALAVTG